MFIAMTSESAPLGYEIVRVIGDCWGEAFDPNQARANVKEYAISRGANAIVNLRLEKYSKNFYPWWLSAVLPRLFSPNYYQTMHRFHGKAVVLMRI
jgi:hypothetical protein